MAREEWEQAYLMALRGRLSKSAAARAAKVHRNTPLYHERRDPSFRRAVRRACKHSPSQ